MGEAEQANCRQADNIWPVLLAALLVGIRIMNLISSHLGRGLNQTTAWPGRGSPAIL